LAFIKCPECSKEVSDQAASCPNCGTAIKKGKITNLLELGKKRLPSIQETGHNYLITVQKSSKKHLVKLQETTKRKKTVAQETEQMQLEVSQELVQSPPETTLKPEQKSMEVTQIIEQCQYEPNKPEQKTPKINQEPDHKPIHSLHDTRTLMCGKKHKNRKILPIATGAIILVVIILICIVGVNRAAPPLSQSPPMEVNTGVIIEYDNNMLMNRFDIRVAVDNIPLGVQQQGEIMLYELTLAEGMHMLSFSEFGNDENNTEERFEVSAANVYYYFFVKSRNSGIIIEKRDSMTRDEAYLLAGIPDNDNVNENESNPDDTPASDVPEEPIKTEEPKATTKPENVDNDEDTPTDMQVDDGVKPELPEEEDISWRDGYISYITRHSGSPLLVLLDVGYDYPVLIVNESIVAFYQNMVYVIDQLEHDTRYGDGIISNTYWKWGSSLAGSDLFLKGYRIQDVVEWLRMNNRRIPDGANCYLYYLRAEENEVFDLRSNRYVDTAVWWEKMDIHNCLSQIDRDALERMGSTNTDYILNFKWND